MRTAILVLSFFFLGELWAQEAQFIVASPYNAARWVDVYRDGQLLLEGVEFGFATQAGPWPSSSLIEVRTAGAPATVPPLLRKRIRIAPGSAEYLILTGDPEYRTDKPPFDLMQVEDAHWVSEKLPYNEFKEVWLVSAWDGYLEHRVYIADARMEIPDAHGAQNFETVVHTHGSVQPWLLTVAFRHEADWRRWPDGKLVMPYLLDMSGVFGLAWIAVTTDVPEWQDPGLFGLGFGDLHITPSGQNVRGQMNTAGVQFIHNSPYPEAESLHVRVVLMDPRAPSNPIVWEKKRMRFGSASAPVALPSGLYVEDEKGTAPELRVEVRLAEQEGEPVATSVIRLRSGDEHLVTITGDPLSRDGHPPLRVDFVSNWRLDSPRTDTTRIALLHGVPDLHAADVYVGRENTASFGYVSVGGSEIVPDYTVRDDTLSLTGSGSNRELARFPLPLKTQALGDSSIVLVSAGFLDPPDRLSPDFGLYRVPPSGGAFVPLEKLAPPPMWTYWWFWAILATALAVIGLAFNQARVMRLRARERELGALVDERTRELQAEKAKTEQQAQRLLELDEAKNRFFANISHEFRTPLTLILGPVQDALDTSTDEQVPVARRAMESMRRSARRLLRLINQLLDLSKLESGNLTLDPRLDDLAAFTREMARSFQPLAERHRLKLSVEVPADVVQARFDADAMEKVLSNLLSNAIKFTPEDGKVALLLEADGDDAVTITVRDTGPGIAPDDLSRIFERFQQADTSIRRKYEGSGIGLTLARELVELHGGTLSVESQVGFGTAFTARLPRSHEPLMVRAEGDGHMVEAVLLEESLLERPVADLEAEADDAAGATLLIVEDNADVREYLRGPLAERYRILEAEDGQEGLEVAQAEAPELILSDVMMPRMDGYELCRRIKTDERLRHIPVVLLTAKAGEQDTIEGLEHGADAYVPKPFSMPELQLRIANLIASRRLMREQFSREVLVGPGKVVASSDEEVFLNQVSERINAHLGDANLSIDWLADEIGLSRRQFERRVHTLTGLTPAQLVRRLRLERASQLLRAHVGTVSEVAYAVGFRSPSHFARVFKQAYEESPTDHAQHPVEL